MVTGDFRKFSITASDFTGSNHGTSPTFDYIQEREEDYFISPDSVVDNARLLVKALDEMGWPQTSDAVEELVDTLDLSHDEKWDMIKFSGPLAGNWGSYTNAQAIENFARAATLAYKDETLEPTYDFHSLVNNDDRVTGIAFSVARDVLIDGPLSSRSTSPEWLDYTADRAVDTIVDVGIPRTLSGVKQAKDNYRSRLTIIGDSPTLEGMLDRALASAYAAIPLEETRAAYHLFRDVCNYQKLSDHGLDRISDNGELFTMAVRAVKYTGAGHDSEAVARMTTKVLHDQGIPTTSEGMKELREAARSSSNSMLDRVSERSGVPRMITDDQLETGVDAALQEALSYVGRERESWSNVYVAAQALKAREELVKQCGFDVIDLESNVRQRSSLLQHLTPREELQDSVSDMHIRSAGSGPELG